MFEIQLFIESFTSFVLSLFIEERSPFKDSCFDTDPTICSGLCLLRSSVTGL